MTSEERFTKIEGILAQLAEGQKVLQDGHIELEAAQLNQQRAHTKLEEALAKFSTETGERITNLTILVDRLVARDLERGSNGHGHEG